MPRRYQSCKFGCGTTLFIAQRAFKENTLIDDDGNAQLCDFGLAKVLENVPTGLTTTTPPACTLRYAAPELVKAEALLHTLKSDVWAWGGLVLAVSLVLPFSFSIMTSILDRRFGSSV